MERRYKIGILTLTLAIAVITIGTLYASCPFSNADVKEATGHIVIQNDSGVVWENEFTYKDNTVLTNNVEGTTLKPGNYTINLVMNSTIDVEEDVEIPPASQWNECPQIDEVVSS